MAEQQKSVACVKVNTSGSVSADYTRYVETRVPEKALASMRCEESEVGRLCGLSVKVYFRDASPGWRAMLQGLAGPPDLSQNNGAATLLLTRVDDGLSDLIVAGDAYVVVDGGVPVTKGQVWGLQEMVNCAMDIYDMDPENMRRGKATLLQWGRQYQHKDWTPPSGTGGVNIYGERLYQGKGRALLLNSSLLLPPPDNKIKPLSFGSF